MELDPTQVRLSVDTTQVSDPRSVSGLRIGAIELGAQLGCGGMAAVYEGLDRGFTPPRRIAVKLMDPALSSEAEFRQRFEREASLVGDFRHDNIVRVHFTGETPRGMKYIVMEYLAGGTLAERLAGGALPADETLAIAAAMADALAYSHARSVVHRDFKPGNILFTGEGKPVLSDFGVAKVWTTEEAALTREAVSIGAPRYMAPEQIRADEVTDRADVYALGITIVEMLTGRALPSRLRFLRGSSAISELRGALPQETPHAIAELLCLCLQVDPRERPDASEARRLIDAAARAAALPAPLPAASSRRRSLSWSAGTLWSAGAALLVLLVAAVYLLLRTETSGPSAVSAAIEPKVVPPGAAANGASAPAIPSARVVPPVAAPPDLPAQSVADSPAAGKVTERPPAGPEVVGRPAVAAVVPAPPSRPAVVSAQATNSSGSGVRQKPRTQAVVEPEAPVESPVPKPAEPAPEEKKEKGKKLRIQIPGVI